MCGGGSGNNTSTRLDAVGVLHSLGELTSLKNSDWVSIADELADLAESDFTRVLEAFRLYRKAQQIERENERPFPKRPLSRK